MSALTVLLEKDMINFTVGPVPSDDSIRALGSHDVPYFRTPEFSRVMLENESMIVELAHASSGSRAIFNTSSGTGSMEAAVMGTLDPGVDRALVVDGGGFGHRFREMLKWHNIPHDAIEIEYGKVLGEEDLKPFRGGNYTAFLVNLGETSQGILYDLDLIGRFCKEESLFLIVDGISSFLADPFDMQKAGVDVLITDAQKALACPPGVAPIILSPAAVKRVETTYQPCMYFDIRSMLRNQERGQTPFTPAVGILLQIHDRLKRIVAGGGYDAEVSRCHIIAQDFRRRLLETDLPLEMRLESPSNAVTYINARGFSVKSLIEEMKNHYGIWLCPNSGPSADTSFRVGHLGAHTLADNALLVSSLLDARRRGYLG